MAISVTGNHSQLSAAPAALGHVENNTGKTGKTVGIGDDEKFLDTDITSLLLNCLPGQTFGEQLRSTLDGHLPETQLLEGSSPESVPVEQSGHLNPFTFEVGETDLLPVSGRTLEMPTVADKQVMDSVSEGEGLYSSTRQRSEFVSGYQAEQTTDVNEALANNHLNKAMASAQVEPVKATVSSAISETQERAPIVAETETHLKTSSVQSRQLQEFVTDPSPVISDARDSVGVKPTSLTASSKTLEIGSDSLAISAQNDPNTGEISESLHTVWLGQDRKARFTMSTEHMGIIEAQLKQRERSISLNIQGAESHVDILKSHRDAFRMVVESSYQDYQRVDVSVSDYGHKDTPEHSANAGHYREQDCPAGYEGRTLQGNGQERSPSKLSDSYSLVDTYA
ncbi:hypothetical protein [Parendozoicomonas sp. Alg238-R29]|uniref:hypothetical protein n=1 Tax=Parendozoicomonas sp. Alg238-R29 TaxID=2993446 RepID=UPI00248DD6E7|nr:hypothetical protein [Parendozoicomonas sp. Alg238-R29]